jgi:hypothetical protein
MPILYQDDTRLVTPHLMFWIAERHDDNTPSITWWCVIDNEGTEQCFRTKDEARRALVQIAEGEPDL